MYFVNEVTMENFWIENFVKQVVRRSKFHGKGLEVRIEKLVTDCFGDGTIYILVDGTKYYIMMKELPDEISISTMDNRLVYYTLMDEGFIKLKEGKVRIQCK